MLKLVVFCIALASSVCLGGCSLLSFTRGEGDMSPQVDLNGRSAAEYREDLGECQSKVSILYEGASRSNNAVIALRQCLIQRGYILLN